MHPLQRFYLNHKAKLARLTALAGVLTVGLLLSRNAPHEVKVQLLLGQTHREIVAVRIDYLRGGQELHGVELTFPEGAPERVNHSVSLPGGELEVRAELRKADGHAVQAVKKLEAPVQGTVLIAVAEPTP